MEKVKFPLEQSQIYLMKTIVGEEGKAIDNYKKWIDSVNIDNYIDSDSYGMLPTLYKHLNSLGYRDKNTNRYLGIYKKSVFKNSMHFYNLQQIGRKLNDLNVPFGVLKGAAYTIKYHQDIGIRSMNDLDIFVFRNDMNQTVSVLNNLGFHSMFSIDVCENLDLRKSFAFSNQLGFEIDLHWISEAEENQYLQMNRAQNHFYKDIDLKLACAEDSVILLLLHASYSNYTYNIRWIFDLFIIISSEKKLSWEDIISRLLETKFPLTVSIMLSTFNEISSLKVSDDIVRRLAVAGNNKKCIRHATKCFVKPKTFLGKLGFYHYNQKHSDKSLLYRLVTFPGHVLARSRFDTFNDMLKSFISKYIFKRNKTR